MFTDKTFIDKMFTAKNYAYYTFSFFISVDINLVVKFCRKHFVCERFLTLLLILLLLIGLINFIIIISAVQYTDKCEI
jgi:predicted PurR-regulated permease PerM